MSSQQNIKIWDALVRSFHWFVVLAVLVAWLSADDYLEIHTFAGYAIFFLVGLRILWGIIGPTHARFHDFVKPPTQAGSYLFGLIQGKAPRFLGHNPAAGWMILLLLTVLLLVAISGVATLAVEEHTGPLVQALSGLSHAQREWIEEAHEFLANLLLGLIALHIVGVLLSSLVHRENLIMSMITGYKRQ